MTSAPNQQVLLRALLHQDLSSFTGKVCETLSPAGTFEPNWHINAITHQLNKCLDGRKRRLIISQPPRSLKSITVSVAFAAWALGHNPSLNFLCVSYSSDLAAHFHRQFRQVVSSHWYRALFQNMRLIRETDLECVTTKNGGRIALSIGGTVTGRGADIIIIDDPMKAEDAHSEKKRATVNEWVRSTLFSRLNDKRKGVIILVMQRLHENDLAGTLIEDGGWSRLNLPAISLVHERIALGRGLYHYRQEGIALHPAREPIETLESIKAAMGSLAFSAQYQQTPVPAEGNFIKRDWFSRYKDPPDATGRGWSVVQSWDHATATGEANDYSVCTTWAFNKFDYYLLDVWRGKKDFPGIRDMTIELARRFNAKNILIEDAGPGQHLIADLKSGPNKIGTPIIGIKPEGSKKDRVFGVSGCIESGQVFLPEEAIWLDVFLDEILGFPNSKHDDQADSMSQFLNWVRTRKVHTWRSQPLSL
jgi:predicted phage terminase large subunit-like protein